VVRSRSSNRSKKKRSKSAASKSKKWPFWFNNPFLERKQTSTKTDEWQDTGLGGGAGWWSEGQSLKNLRRHRENNGLPPYTAADRIEHEVASATRTPKTGRQSEAIQTENGDAVSVARTPKSGRQNEDGVSFF
jgi:hypothetical protein